MEIMELATAIGAQIKTSPEGIRFLEAKKAYEGSTEINNALMEYQVQQMAISEGQGETDDEVIARIDDRLNELYSFITEHPLFKEFEAAEGELNTLLGKVQATIIAEVTGKKPSDCTHDCSTCGGCH